YIAAAPNGGRVNPNYAASIVLQSIPGMTSNVLQSILEMRAQAVFAGVEDFRDRMRISSDSPVLKHLAFDRGPSPAILAIARLKDSSQLRTERRVRRQIPRRRGPPVL